MSDPNEGNPFEPPETREQQDRRVGEMIRRNADERRARYLAAGWKDGECVCCHQFALVKDVGGSFGVLCQPCARDAAGWP